MFSYITKDFNVGFTFDKYLRLVAHTLNKLGVKAEATGRNDITVDGKKISGNAFYRTAGKSIVHGTMLFDTNIKDLVLSITPSNEKLITKGIESVRKRVTNLKEYLDIDIGTFKSFMRTQLCDSEIAIQPEEITGIENIEKEYLKESWILGNNPRYTLIKKGYGTAGEIEIRLEIKNGIIKEINLMGDYFPIGEMERFLNTFTGVTFEYNTIRNILDKIKIEEYILNLTQDQFLEILFEENKAPKH